MNSKEVINFIKEMEKMKCNTRHCWTSTGRHESVAEHSWRLAIFALVISFHIPEVNFLKLIVMCLIHDLGEAITGDIPTFEKTEEDKAKEKQAVEILLQMLDGEVKQCFTEILGELEDNKSKEAKICHALDRLEGIIQHNESNIDTWLPIEYELQLTYGVEESKCSSFLLECRNMLKEETLTKIKSNTKTNL